ncbi:YicC/YloC family endoribonuclease [Alloacidobacterium sp.]|uniref:YicC/YloC family endoribonuclease n=1 Tax=Alloacidobacterium sp. TaxID=2951999 RepID=UPI002D2598E5|nr:YicC/YloC family endoribonuclease [Alloacidobacterium sp.]HYK36106.1 YicC/YloC family endoribonuclease [Alloacidobacterium sp.]
MTPKKEAAAPTKEALPIHSMTGFARAAERLSDKLGYTLSLKSVNHRFLDLHMRLPSGTESLEMQLRKVLKERIARGHVEVSLSIDRSTKMEAQYDQSLVAAYVTAFRSAAAQYGLTAEPDLNSIFRLPGVLNGDSRNSEEEVQSIESAVLKRVSALIGELNTMRSAEGDSLAAELRKGLARLSGFVEGVAGLRQDVQKAYFERIAQRMSEMLDGNLDRDRLLQEAALLAERSDVEEEIARMNTHIAHFESLLDQGGEIGKKLDFLLQEMNREANTLLSKTSGLAGNGTRITELGLGMKSEIEKAREQVQNLE